MGLILAVTAVLFFGLGYWYARGKSEEEKHPVANIEEENSEQNGQEKNPSVHEVNS